MTRSLLLIAALLGATGVALGAFGAHGLEATLLASGRLDTFDTASRYHLLHAVALIGVAWLTRIQPGRWSSLAGWLLTAGTVIFSGSLYVLAIFNLGFMGAVAPLGGVALVAGWGCIGLAAWQMSADRALI